MELLSIVLLLAILAEVSYVAVNLSRTRRGGKREEILLDTSVLIDGRILDVARSGLLTARLVVPRSVVRELQFMADKADHDKRERARFGLEIIEKLQQMPNLDVSVLDDGTTSQYGVDEQLIVLAQRTGAKLCTIDYNLNKAARVQAVEVININELAHALRVVHLPGEKIAIELVQPGQDKKQGVGYLDDGTMVVVEDARDQIGKTVDVELTRVLQTAAGRMMFARKTAKPSIERTYAKGEARSSMFASLKDDKERASTVANKKSSHTLSKPQNTRKNTGTTLTQTTKAPRKSQVRRQQPRNTTPEDKLVDLANK